MNQLSAKLRQYCMVAVVLMIASAPAVAKIEKQTLWRDAVVTDINVDFGGTGFHASYRYQRCDCGDLLIQTEQDAPDSIEKGDLLMIEGQTLLSKGFGGQGGDIAPLMQAPLLMLQLVDALLNRSQPEGPFTLESEQRWNVVEPNMDFNLNTGFATGTFTAPWSVKGKGWKTSESEIRIELTFKFVAPTEDDPDTTSYITLSGSLDFQEQDFPIPENTLLEGWHIQHFAAGEDQSRLVNGDTTLKALRSELSDQ